MTAPTLDAVDAELARWRSRLAAASRNVSELSELPAFLDAKRATAGTGRLASEARILVATMDELWQGVLLIGAALDRAAEVRRGGSRLWRGEEAAAAALEVLTGPSIRVDLQATPVLHRDLLAGARATATVSPDTLLRTMTAAFDSARARLARLEDSAGQAAALQGGLHARAAALPGDWSARLAAADRPDVLDRLDALQALCPAVEAAEAAQAGIAASRAALDALRTQAAAALAAADTCRAAVAGSLPPLDGGALPELATWLDRIGATLAAGRTEASRIGLQNWRAQHDAMVAQTQALSDAAAAGLARRDELHARLGLLRAKRRARPAAGPVADPALTSLDGAAAAALAATPCDVQAAAAALRAYQAALA